MSTAPSMLARNAMTLVMLVIFVIMVAVASTWPEEARFMPFVIGFPAIALCLLQLFLDWRKGAAPVAEDGDEDDIRQALREGEERVSRITGRQMKFDVAHDMTIATEEVVPDAEAARREKFMWAAFLSLVLGIVLFGFHIALPVFLIVFLRFIARQSWFKSILAAVVATAFLVLVFEVGLRAQLYPGAITGYVLESLAQ